jgi:dTDP-4-amino-4,6-dideoxygalactose transaminase
MEVLSPLVQGANIALIEDAAQSFGAERGGRKAGSWGDLASFSMNPMKVLAACGEAGVIVTDQESCRDRLTRLRYNGTINKEVCQEPSLNYRLDTIQAAILLYRLTTWRQGVLRRRQIAALYRELLPSDLDLPQEEPGSWDVYYTYQIKSDKRDALKAFLETRGIEVKIQHPYLMSEQLPYRGGGACPQGERWVKRILCLPIHEKLSDEEIEHVAISCREFFAR